jgi:hypothetical protein
MFTARPRNLRTFLHDASIKALKCANETRSGSGGDPSAAGGARVLSAVLAEVRDAVDLRAPWLTDYPQVVFVIGEAVRASSSSPVRLAMTVEELARLVVDEVSEARAAAAQAALEAAEGGDEGREGGAQA